MTPRFVVSGVFRTENPTTKWLESVEIERVTNKHTQVEDFPGCTSVLKR